MKKIIEAGELPEGEKVYLKKDFLGWRTVEPWKADGKIKWFNFITGGKRNLIFLLIIMIIVSLLYFGINELIMDYKTIADSPCDFCEDCFSQTRKVMQGINKNFKQYPKINFTLGGAE